MKNLLNPADRDGLVARLENLRPDSRPRWGRLTARQVLPHLADPIRASLGEKEAADASNAVFRGPVGRAVALWLPWPKGAPTSPSFLPGTGLTAPGEFEADRKALLLLVHRFSNLHDPARLTVHPVFGRLGHRQLGRLYWRHIDHHLRQFSC